MSGRRVLPIALAWLVGACVGACHDQPAPPPATAAAAIEVPQATPPASGPTPDLVVATVDGRPVYGSCVSAQLRPGLDARAALDECIGFELLAGEAAARGLAADADVQRELRRALADGLVAREFEATLRGPGDLPRDLVEQALAENREVLVHGEWREAVFVRANVVATQPDMTDADARALIDAVRAALPVTRGLTEAELFAAATAVGEARVGANRVADAGQTRALPIKLELERRRYRTPDDERTELPFRKALFALADIGDVSEPVRTSLGWNLVLYSDRLPAKTPTRAEQEQAVFADLRPAYFERWLVAEVARGHEVTVDVGPLEADEQRVASSSATGGEAP